MIDLHCHVLPGIDDGPATLAQSIELCREAHAAGTRTIVATPHVSWEYPGNDATTIAQACAELNLALEEAGVAVDVLPGAEVALTRAMELGDDELRALTLGGGPWLMVEAPFTFVPRGFFDLLEGMHDRGHRIVLAHPERISTFQRDRDGFERLLRLGMLASVTAGSIGGSFGKLVQRFTLELLRSGLVDNVASDAHGPHLARPPRLDATLRSHGFASHVTHLCHDVPAAILQGTALPIAPPLPPEPRRGRTRWRWAG